MVRPPRRPPSNDATAETRSGAAHIGRCMARFFTKSFFNSKKILLVNEKGLRACDLDALRRASFGWLVKSPKCLPSRDAGGNALIRIRGLR